MPSSPEQLHEDLRQIRATLEKTRDDSATGIERLQGKISDLHVQVASLQAQREFGNAALQAMVKIAIHEALAEHTAKITDGLSALERRVKVLEDDKTRVEGMTQAGKIGVTVLQLPGVGAALYLIGKALGIVQ